MSFLSFIRSPKVKQAIASLFAEFQSEVMVEAAPVAAAPVAAAPVGWDKVETSVEPVAAAPAEKSPADKLAAALVNPKFRFRSLTALAKASGLSGVALETALVEIGARPAVKRGYTTLDSWGLISRVGVGPHGRPVVAANPNRAKLIALLSDPAYKFRSYDTLLDKLGCDQSELDSLLEDVKARPVVVNGQEGDFYGLVSRVGAGPLADNDDGEDDFDDEDDGEDGFDDDDDFDN